MIPVYNSFIYNGVSSRDFEVWISGSGTFSAPSRDVTTVQVPGRNGDLSIDNKRFNNIQINYPAFLLKDFRQNFDAFKAFLCSQSGYKRLEDTYHPEYYRLAMYSDELNPNMKTLNRSGTFDITFNCDPRRFLKDGEKAISLTADATVTNKTLYPSKPLIRCYGTGTLTINDNSITVTSANGYTDIDCETENAYKGSVNCNGNLTFGSIYKKFFVLESGDNSVSFTGFSQVDITPNWWTV